MQKPPRTSTFPKNDISVPIRIFGLILVLLLCIGNLYQSSKLSHSNAQNDAQESDTNPTLYGGGQVGLSPSHKERVQKKILDGKPEKLQAENVAALPTEAADTKYSTGQVERSEGKPPLHVFMNAYFPSKNIPGKHPVSKWISLRILRDQVGQIARSLGSRTGTSDQSHSTMHAIVHVVTVENDIFRNNTKLLHDTCRQASNGTVQCVYDLHVDEGGEADTLSVLYEHCSSSSTAEDTRVTYMHNKGSFHPTPANSNWRPALTAAVVSKECVEPPDHTCNLCGLTFAAPPTMFTVLMPGNFFTASCKYVKQLLHPQNEFLIRQDTLIRKASRKMSNGGRLLFNFYRNKPWTVGKERYAAEHWIGGHPGVIPCDMSESPDYWFWEQNGYKSDADFRWSMAPRYKTYNATFHYNHNPRHIPFRHNPDLRLLDYGLLAGLLYRWMFLYNATPPASSWVWDAMPDGLYWKDALATHAHEVVDVITSPDFDRNASMAAFTEKNG